MVKSLVKKPCEQVRGGIHYNPNTKLHLIYKRRIHIVSKLVEKIRTVNSELHGDLFTVHCLLIKAPSQSP